MSGEEISDESRVLRNEVVSSREARALLEKANTDWAAVAAKLRRDINRANHRGDNPLRPLQGRKRGLGRNRAYKRGKVSTKAKK